MPSQLLIVQPYLTAYRLPVFAELATHFSGTVLASSPPPENAGYGEPDIAGTAIQRHLCLPELKLLGGRLFWQKGLLRFLLRHRPRRVLLPANPRGLSMWAALLACRLLGLRCYAYGQGFYDKPDPPRWLVAAYRLLTTLSHCYICYTTSGLDSLRQQGVRGVLAVAENSLRLDDPVLPQEKTGQEPGILFVGRLRAGCNLPLLIHAAQQTRKASGAPLELHVVGAGEQAADLQRRYQDLPWVHWHGQVYQQAQVRRIASDCRVGCYPGDAGLSVVHYMGLSLVPVIHDRLDLHMGPEPSYVEDGVNGRRFCHADAERSLAAVLENLFQNTTSGPLAEQAFATYRALNEPPLGARLAHVINAH